MKILLIGANGQVGSEVVQQVNNHDLLALDRNGLDISDPQAVKQVLTTSKAQIVINAAAYTAVDRAEQEPELAFAANRDGPAYLATVCAGLGLPLIHISTDYVFDGRNTKPYRENDPVSPLGIYGRSKWEGEEAVRQALPNHLILRVSWVFGVYGHNFVRTMLRLAHEREQLRVVNDQQGCPTYAGHIAAVLLQLAEQVASGAVQEADWGTYHYCGSPATTWYDFARHIVDLASEQEALKVSEVIPITTNEFPTPATRPAHSVLDNSQLQARFGIVPGDWRQGLQTMLAQIYNVQPGGHSLD